MFLGSCTASFPSTLSYPRLHFFQVNCCTHFWTMLSFVSIVALALHFFGASAILPNSTSNYTLTPAVTKAPSGNCSNNCAYQLLSNSIVWFPKRIYTTHTVETVVLIVNKSNSTRTTTISNTDVDLGGIATPRNLNSAGTVITSLVDNDGSTCTV